MVQGWLGGYSCIACPWPHLSTVLQAALSSGLVDIVLVPEVRQLQEWGDELHVMCLDLCLARSLARGAAQRGSLFPPLGKPTARGHKQAAGSARFGIPSSNQGGRHAMRPR